MFIFNSFKTCSGYSSLASNKSLIEENLLVDFSKQYDLCELLPYDTDKKKGAELRNGLKEYQMLLFASIEAVSALEKDDLVKFDSLIGENACEIRAIWIAIIASKKLVNTEDLKRKIMTVQDQIKRSFDQKAIERLMRSGISLRDVLVSHSLFIPLNFEAIFIIQSFLLTEAKVTISNLTLDLCIKEKCDPKKIKSFGDISFSFADHLLKKARKFIAASSVQFVRERAYELDDENLIKMLSDRFTINHNNYLPCTPMFWTYKSILSIAQSERIPLIIYAKFLERELDRYKIIDEDWLFFEPDSDISSSDLIQHNKEEMDYGKIVWVVQGVVCPHPNKSFSKFQWRQNMSKYPINRVILAGAADHRQYPNSEHDELISPLEHHEYAAYRSFAKAEGFSLDNPAMFFIQHVYPSQIGASITKRC